MIELRQSTASQEIPLGIFVDSTDGNTEESGLSIANTDIKIWKTGATTLASKNSGGATYISNGIYYCVLDATDTDTIGPMVIFIHVSGALAVRVECCVLDEAVYDVRFGTTAPATATNITAGTITTATNVTTVNGLASGVITATSIAADAITAAKIADGAIDAGALAADCITAAKIATGAIDADALAADAVAEIADGVWDEDATGHQTQGTFGQAIGDPGADTDTIWGLANTNLDAAVSSRMATYTQPTGFLAATFPATVASTTNITAGTITTVSGNVNGSVGSVTGAVGSVTGNVGGNVTGTIGGLTAAALADFFDTDSGTTYASAVAGSVVKEIADNAGSPSDVAAIKAKTDSLTFTVAGQVDANIRYVNNIAIDGVGTSGNPWGPA